MLTIFSKKIMHFYIKKRGIEINWMYKSREWIIYIPSNQYFIIAEDYHVFLKIISNLLGEIIPGTKNEKYSKETKVKYAYIKEYRFIKLLFKR